MREIEAKVAEDAGLNRLRDLINRPEDDSGEEDEGEEGDVFDPVDVQQGEE